MGARPPRSVIVWIAVGLVAAATVALYAPTLSGGFIADDVFYLRSLSTQDGALAGALTGPLLGSRETAFYRPLPLASLALDLALWGTDRALGFRLVNLLIHLMNALLVGSIAARVLRPTTSESTGVPPAAGLAGALFALHPLTPEAVAWISGRFDLLATLFSLLALRLAMAGLDHGGGRRGRLAHGLALVSFAAALASKESAAGLPLAIAAWAALGGRAPTENGASGDRRDAWSRAWSAAWPFVVVAGLYLVLRGWALGTFLGGYREAPLEWWQKEFWTVRLLAVLALVVPHPILYAVPKKLTFCILAYPALAVGALAALRHRSPVARRASLFAVVWMAAALAPHFPVLALRPTLESARVLYLAVAPFALLVATLVDPGGRTAAGPERLRWLTAGAVLAGAVLLLGHNLGPWVGAGRTTRELRREVVALAANLPEGVRAVVDGVPDHLEGALVLRNGEALARTPFVPPEADGRVELRVGEGTGDDIGDCDTPGIDRFRWEGTTRSLVAVDCG